MNKQEIHLRNLEILITEAGTKKQLAQRAKCSYTFICQVHSTKRLLSGNTRGLRRMGSDLCRKLEVAQGKPLGWMDQDHDQPGTDAHAGPFRRVPILNWDEAARVKLMDARELLKKEATIVVVNANRSGLFALIVRDDAMVDPTLGALSFPVGATIIVDPNVDAEPMDYVVAQLPGASEAVFKQLVHDGLQLCLRSLNPNYAARGMLELPSKSAIIGVVVGLQVNIPPRAERK